MIPVTVTAATAAVRSGHHVGHDHGLAAYHKGGQAEI